MDVTAVLNTSQYDPILESMRRLYSKAKDWERPLQEALVVLHGHAERLTPEQQRDPRVLSFLNDNLRRLQAGQGTALAVENEAATVGLALERGLGGLLKTTMYPACVNEIQAGRARITLFHADNVGVMDMRWFPVDWLPKAHRSVGVSLAWVERTYAQGPRGRFEPAGDIERS